MTNNQSSSETSDIKPQTTNDLTGAKMTTNFEDNADDLSTSPIEVKPEDTDNNVPSQTSTMSCDFFGPYEDDHSIGSPRTAFKEIESAVYNAALVNISLEFMKPRRKNRSPLKANPEPVKTKAEPKPEDEDLFKLKNNTPAKTHWLSRERKSNPAIAASNKDKQGSTSRNEFTTTKYAPSVSGADKQVANKLSCDQQTLRVSPDELGEVMDYAARIAPFIEEIPTLMEKFCKAKSSSSIKDAEWAVMQACVEHADLLKALSSLQAETQ